MPPDPRPLPERFGLIIDGLCRSAAAHLARRRDKSALLLLFWSWLRRTAIRFERLATRIAQGGPARVDPRVRDRAGRTRPAATPRPPLPRRFGWMLPLVPDATGYRSQLEHLLAGADMAELVAAAPHVARLLAPLCRMLWLDPIKVPEPRPGTEAAKQAPGLAPGSAPAAPSAGVTRSPRTSRRRPLPAPAAETARSPPSVFSPV